MYDTIRVRSPYISEQLAQAIENHSILRQAINLKSGQMVYEFTNASLSGSYDSRISVQVSRQEYIVPKKVFRSKAAKDAGKADNVVPDWRIPFSQKNRNSPIKVDCQPYVVVEASVHKAMAGHNCYGGPNRFHLAVFFLLNLIERLLDIELPLFLDWIVHRVDFARCFELPSHESCQEWFRTMKNAYYTRREVSNHGLHSIHVSGKTTVFKAYLKGDEFRKHGDLKKLSKLWDDSRAFELYDRANRIIRVEIGVKRDKFRHDLGDLPRVRDLSDRYFEHIYDVEVKRFIRDGYSEFEVARDLEGVQNRLINEYGPTRGMNLFAFWTMLRSTGEQSVKKKYTKPTFYRNRKFLQDVGVSWHVDAVMPDFSLIPTGFSPVAGDSLEITEILPDVFEIEQSLSPVLESLLEAKKNTAHGESSTSIICS